ncbi:xanthine dehydrogenase family protein molybdopterin-binding subunit [Spiractinospora alimapuensis]|uniref:xanthine dehydrogenase family protein molybdopterin-binding subunit n=1 Tax=Spiractinospora alimapuensis TaxID=2820884 RepID=UPI0022AACD55|nr:molybdopterin cofactor-binding domain-containing protein [Spiractinospora alimapuensis]QVQ53328.1 xanthine dehydrogenase family protein molybdopterin-binding subunit [Spiractinospora alimapuensis]
MALRHGRGYATVNYPTGMNLGGDPTQALVHATTTGAFVVSLSSVDLGQGIKTVAAQVAAETLGIDVASVIVDTADTDTGPHCMGTFASRGTHRVGNAIIMAAKEAREALLEAAGEVLEADPRDLEVAGGHVRVRGAGHDGVHVSEVALAAHFSQGRTISGRGIAMKEPSVPDPETGAMDPDSCQAHACTMAEVVVDDETGVVEVQRLHNVYEVGRVINPAMAVQQVEGGSWMGVSHALFETTEPYYPRRDHGPLSFASYLMPGHADTPTIECVFLERPAANGPFGAKGIGEMTANAPIPAIANAIHAACGVRLNTMPFTPERVLRALDELADHRDTHLDRTEGIA